MLHQHDWEEALVGEEVWCMCGDKEARFPIRGGEESWELDECARVHVLQREKRDVDGLHVSPMLCVECRGGGDGGGEEVGVGRVVLGAPAISLWHSPRCSAVCVSESGSIAVGGSDGVVVVADSGIERARSADWCWPREEEEMGKTPKIESASKSLGMRVPLGLLPFDPSLSLEGHLSTISDLQYVAAGNALLSSSSDLSLRIWSAKTGHCGAILRSHTSSVLTCDTQYDGKRIFSGDRGGSVLAWDTATASVTGKASVDGAALGIAALSDEGRPEVVVASDGDDGLRVMSICGSGDGGDGDGEVGVEGEELVSLGVASPSCVTVLGSGLVVAGTTSGEVVVCDVRSPAEPVSKIAFGEEIVAVHACGSDIIGVAGRNGSAWVLKCGSTGVGSQIALTGAREPLSDIWVGKSLLRAPGGGAEEHKEESEEVIDGMSAIDAPVGPEECLSAVTVGRDGVVRVYRGIERGFLP